MPFLVFLLVLASSMPTIAIPDNIAPLDESIKTPPKEFNGVKDIGGLQNTIRLNEGTRHNVYLDKRRKVTVGVGFNLSRKDAGQKFREAGIDVVALATKQASLSHVQIEMLFERVH